MTSRGPRGNYLIDLDVMLFLQEAHSLLFEIFVPFGWPMQALGERDRFYTISIGFSKYREVKLFKDVVPGAQMLFGI